MDSDGLPLVGPGVDYTKVESISQKRLVTFLNHFVSHTAGFLNRFSCVCEEKLENLSYRMQNLEVTMGLLEAKISSIPGLDNVTASSGASSTGQTPSTDSTVASAPMAPAAPPPPGATPEQTAADSVPPPPVEEQKPDNPVSKDPRYMRFFKMVQVGVPGTAVKLKMSAEGLNPDLLDTPDAPAPAGGTSNDDSDDDFSNSSGEQSNDSDDFD